MSDKKDLKSLPKEEIAERYAKLRASSANAKAAAKKETEALMGDVITVASAGGVAYLMSKRHQEAEDKAMSEGLTGEDLEKAKAEGAQIAGIDMDLIIGGAAAAVGITKLGGKMSETARRIGIGGLSAYAARMGSEKGREAASKEEEE